MCIRDRLYRVNGVLGLRLSGVPLVYSKLCFVCDLVLNSVRHTVLHFHWTQGSISWGHVSLERTSVPRVCVDVNSLYRGRLRGSRAPRLHQRRIFISHMTFTYCAACGYISFTVFFRSVSHASVKSTKFSRRYQIVRLSEVNEIWHIGSPDFSVYHEIGELWPRESPWSAKILKGVKQFCSAFLIHRLAKRDEIWQG